MYMAFQLKLDEEASAFLDICRCFLRGNFDNANSSSLDSLLAVAGTTCSSLP